MPSAVEVPEDEPTEATEDEPTEAPPGIPGTHSYTYDAIGRRVSKTVNGTQTIFVCSGPQVVCDYQVNVGATPDTASPTQCYVYGSYVDEVILKDGQFTDSTASGILFYHRNQQYSIVALTDGQGNVVECYAYTAYGETTILDADGNEIDETKYSNPYTYTGRRADEELGLLYFRARYYDPQTGEFISRDPLGYVDGMSQYRAYFVPSGMDPSGECQEECSVKSWGFDRELIVVFTIGGGDHPFSLTDAEFSLKAENPIEDTMKKLKKFIKKAKDKAIKVRGRRKIGAEATEVLKINVYYEYDIWYYYGDPDHYFSKGGGSIKDFRAQMTGHGAIGESLTTELGRSKTLDAAEKVILSIKEKYISESSEFSYLTSQVTQDLKKRDLNCFNNLTKCPSCGNVDMPIPTITGGDLLKPKK